MPMNHHVLAKVTTDAVLQNFKTGKWQCAGNSGANFYRCGVSADFPSPDAAFYDPTLKTLVSFEFKPPTESKRGILTGVGQALAYLQSSNVSFLVAPDRLQDFDLSSFLTNLFQKQIQGKLSAGLIIYNCNNPSLVSMPVSVLKPSAVKILAPRSDRFWAKHQDLPVPLFHLILHYYYLKKVGQFSGDAFTEFWNTRMVSPNILSTFKPIKVFDIDGVVIKTLSGKKDFMQCEKILSRSSKMPTAQRIVYIQSEINTGSSKDNLYNSIRKNYVTFLKHLQMIDSNGDLTESGFAMYNLGVINGPSSKMFYDYFMKEILTSGHHLDLILDFDALKQKNPSSSVSDILELMEADYTNRGMIKKNPNRVAPGKSSKVGFLKYERILWNALGLVSNDGLIDWKKITEVCSLPDLY